MKKKKVEEEKEKKEKKGEEEREVNGFKSRQGQTFSFVPWY